MTIMVSNKLVPLKCSILAYLYVCVDPGKGRKAEYPEKNRPSAGEINCEKLSPMKLDTPNLVSVVITRKAFR